MADKPKFIQIAASTTESNQILVALDEEGDVWSYRFMTKGGDKEQWVKLKSDRKS